jgi:hypothetical protein
VPLKRVGRLATLCFVFGVLGVPVGAPRAVAAPAWIYRGIVLPRGVVAMDFGVGVAHAPTAANTSDTGAGLNVEISGGLTNEVELGVRAGFRLDDAGQRMQADRYGRPFQTETYGGRTDRTANPEVHARWAMARGSSVELGLDLRAYLPIEHGSRFGLMLGVPITLRAASIRIDTGLFVPVVFYDPTATVVSVPVHLWIQVTHVVWLGPLFGFRVVSENGASHDEYPLGFGLGAALARAVDLRTWLVFPDMNRAQAARTFGAGLALQIRFE